MNDAKQKKEIPQELERLEKEIDALEEEIANNEQSFAQVISQEVLSTGVVEEKIGQGVTCELAEKLRSFSNKVSGLRSRLLSISSRSQV